MALSIRPAAASASGSCAAICACGSALIRAIVWLNFSESPDDSA
jgi:hypothetical protein